MENEIPVPPKKQDLLFGKIETEDGALKVIKYVSNAIYVLAALQIVVWLVLLGVATVVDWVIFAVCAFILQRYKSRAIAVILLVLSVLAIISTAINSFGGGSGGQNVGLAFLVVFISVRAVQATYKLKKLRQA